MPAILRKRAKSAPVRRTKETKRARRTKPSPVVSPAVSPVVSPAVSPALVETLKAEVAVEKAAEAAVLTNDRCKAFKFAQAAKVLVDRVARSRHGLRRPSIFTKQKLQRIATAATFVHIGAVGLMGVSALARAAGRPVPNVYRLNLAPTASMAASLASNACKYMAEPTFVQLIALAKSIWNKKQVAGYVAYMSSKRSA